MAAACWGPPRAPPWARCLPARWGLVKVFRLFSYVKPGYLEAARRGRELRAGHSLLADGGTAEPSSLLEGTPAPSSLPHEPAGRTRSMRLPPTLPSLPPTLPSLLLRSPMWRCWPAPHTTALSTQISSTGLTLAP